MWGIVEIAMHGARFRSQGNSYRVIGFEGQSPPLAAVLSAAPSGSPKEASLTVRPKVGKESLLILRLGLALLVFRSGLALLTRTGRGPDESEPGGPGLGDEERRKMKFGSVGEGEERVLRLLRVESSGGLGLVSFR